MAVPDTVALAMTHLADELREGLLALAVGTGLQVMDAILEESVTALCGPMGRHDPARTAVGHGHEDGSVVLVPVKQSFTRSGSATTDACERSSRSYARWPRRQPTSSSKPR